MAKRKTTHIRVYKEDYIQVKQKFPNIKMPDMFHVAIKTNPLMQLEAALRGKKKKNK